ncbi:MAG: flagellar export protein FliJ [Methylobacteriaceae bacterium]|nr:flagellar export protein FliJ [Methylobacteriaceae bacterium]
MKSRDTLIRLKRFQVEDRRRRVAQIELMIAEFTRMSADLDREIAAEEKRAGISDPTHFAYPTYARAAMTRRDNVMRSRRELEGQLDEARAAMEDARAELAKAESLDGRERLAEARERELENRALDGMSAMQAARI